MSTEITRYIFPAPDAVKNVTSVLWYDAEFLRSDATVMFRAHLADGTVFSTYRVSISVNGNLSALIEQDNRSLSIALYGDINNQRLALKGQIAGKRIEIFSSETASDVQIRANLDEGDDDLLSCWRGLIPSIESLRAAARQSEACDDCLLIGGNLTYAAEECNSSGGGACGSLIGLYGMFQDGCVPPPCH